MDLQIPAELYAVEGLEVPDLSNWEVKTCPLILELGGARACLTVTA